MINLLKNFLICSCLLLLPLAFSGCVWLVVGGVGALGGYVISPDTVEGVASHSSEELFASAVKVVGIMGHIQAKNKTAGEISAQIAGAEVQVTVVAMNTQTARVRVKARKFFLPKIQTAQDVYIKIIEQLQE